LLYYESSPLLPHALSQPRAPHVVCSSAVFLGFPRPDSSGVERGPEKAGVGGSNPSLATTQKSIVRRFSGNEPPQKGGVFVGNLTRYFALHRPQKPVQAVTFSAHEWLRDRSTCSARLQLAHEQNGTAYVARGDHTFRRKASGYRLYGASRSIARRSAHSPRGKTDSLAAMIDTSAYLPVRLGEFTVRPGKR
jgi:hypothetical protein